MFKKLKDKLAEEVKSSPQRIQQFAQAAQAAVTSASSSISDITNNDLFSIGDNDISQSRSVRPTALTRPAEQNAFQDVALMQSASMQASTEEIDFTPRPEQSESHNQRRLSNSSFASDVSFRLPNYESPALYHLQSDMEVSASEAEERGFSSGAASLDRVTKEQLYAAYKRTQQRYEKYRTQYADLARHYKFLERDNAKARSVLVETQDKALRRISELREQCTLEQSAKAHLEKALRLEIDEKNMKIEALQTKITCMQDDTDNKDPNNEEEVIKEQAKELQLIDFSGNNDRKTSGYDGVDNALTNKTEKLEQLLNKYKESLKLSKEKNAQLTTDLHLLTTEIENKNKENEQLKHSSEELAETRKKNLELQESNEELQNKLNTYEFNQMKEQSALELDLQKALEEIKQLQCKIEVFNKREEEYAISLAENKLSIHKELESKEAEIKSLKDHLTACKNEVQSLNIVVNDYKKSISSLEDEKCKLNSNISELNSIKALVLEKESQIKQLTLKCKNIEQAKMKADEECKCLQFQIKQETAEKLAMVDRNAYLETKNTKLTEENSKKKSQINELETQLHVLRKDNEERENRTDQNKVLEELESWRNKYYTLESEIQDERDELVKLQSEIEKLLQNHEVSQSRNLQLLESVSELTAKNAFLKENSNQINKKCLALIGEISTLKNIVHDTGSDAKLMRQSNEKLLLHLGNKVSELIKQTNDDQIGSFKATIEKLQKELSITQNNLMELKHQFDTASNELIECREDNNKLNELIKSLRSDKTIMDINIKKAEDNYQDTQSQLNRLENDKSVLLTKVTELEVLSASLQSTISREREENLPLQEKLLVLEKENNKLLLKLKEAEVDNEDLKTKYSEIEALKSQNEKLLAKSNENCAYIKKLEDDVKLLSQENILLKNQSQNIASNLKALEMEISEVRKSHSEIESEKDHLNTIIRKLEETENAKQCQTNVDVQTDDSSFSLDLLFEENKVLKDKCEQFKQEKESLYEKLISVEHDKDTLVADIATQKSYTLELEEENKKVTEVNSELLSKVSILEDMCRAKNEAVNEPELEDIKRECVTLKDENRRLTSDIEGLQMHLAKISKENSTLNDKLRELIASEHVDKGENLSSDFVESLNGNQSDTDRINELVRENTLLVEENLELKDQLRSQNYGETSNSNSTDTVQYKSEMEVLKEKYNTLLATKNKYEKQLSDMELINKSMNGNIQNVQENNEKLRLSNEKLERRLDEALVSLRHLHSLQENTELEYLRNVLYEYLTGSGTHSITLAKVLAAVVKFDEMQTNIILQKEKERQGLLRQLGLL
ncbi:golgin subfamily A member 4-like isoform X2 [Cydia splendana]|uniref:golgin subfamily A member 4-like isoform X2 n=1 Tax=Cydia splendana TaxID=1100963 RepID=UPI00300D1CBF